MADLIFINGEIITMDTDNLNPECVVVTDGIITHVGTMTDVSILKSEHTKIVNLKGKTLIPGLIESHTHPIMSAVDYNADVDITGFDGATWDHIQFKIKQRVSITPPGEWVRVSGYNPMIVTDMPALTLDILDELCPDNPMYVMSFSRHNTYFNSKAFEVTGLHNGLSGVGDVLRDADGKPTGQLNEDTSKFSYSCIPKIDPEKGRLYIRKQLMDYASHGFTTIAALGLFPSFENGYEIFKEEVQSPACPISVAVYHTEVYLDTLDTIPIPTTNTTSKYNLNGVKLFADGSPYVGTMATFDPYLCTDITQKLGFAKGPQYGGLSYQTEEDFYQTMFPYHKKGLQIAVHAHGDLAISQTLNTYERILREYPRQDHRHRLEHCGLMTMSQLAKAKSLGVTPSFFVDHIHYFGHSLKHDIIGPERAARFMPVGDANDIGHTWTLHSDSPCCPPGPFRVMKTAVTREMNFSKEEARVLGDDQRVKIEDVIKAFTVNAAWQIHRENDLGKIKIGYCADLVILSVNPLTIPVMNIDSIRCTHTYKGGNLVYRMEDQQ